jgi:uncharacterized protein YecE (DUF72 family)
MAGSEIRASRAGGRLYAGTSGFAYRQWKPGFYPATLKNADMLRYYAERLPSVEVNNTFYRMPTEALFVAWREQTPARFAFSLKAPQRITHIARLRDVEEPLGFFLRVARTLGPRLGCILFQCPPYLRYEADRLDAFLDALPDRGMRFAMEFRHPSWSDEAVREKLVARSIAWCCVDADGVEANVEETAAKFVYVRLRKPAYDGEALARWRKRLAVVLERGADAYVYFKHEDDPSGVRYAAELLKRA